MEREQKCSEGKSAPDSPRFPRSFARYIFARAPLSERLEQATLQMSAEASHPREA